MESNAWNRKLSDIPTITHADIARTYMGNIQRHHQTLYTRDVSQCLDSYAHKVEGKKNVDTCFGSSVVH